MVTPNFPADMVPRHRGRLAVTVILLLLLATASLYTLMVVAAGSVAPPH